MKIYTILLFIALWSNAAFGAPAIDREIVFEQPDGTFFYGKLKGDAAFHWIESNGNVVVYNPEDKYYYKAIVDTNRGVIRSTEKIQGMKKHQSALQAVTTPEKKVSKEMRQKLYFLYKKAKASNGPR